MTEPGRTELIRRVRGALWRGRPGAVLVLRPDDSVIRLTGPGSVLWLMLEEPATVAELADAFVAADDPGLLDGLGGYLVELRDLGLVEIS